MSYTAKGVNVMPINDDFFNMGIWLSSKFKYHKSASHNKIKNAQVNHGEVWYCDLGYNIGEEKNKCRPVIIISNNKINRTGKVIAACITDTNNKLNSKNLPAQDSWYLLYSSTSDVNKMIFPNRTIPSNQNTYSFLDKDSLVQCEEIRIVSKARLDFAKGSIGTISPDDLKFIKQKLKRVFEI